MKAITIRFAERNSLFEVSQERLKDIAGCLGVSQNKAVAYAINMTWENLNKTKVDPMKENETVKDGTNHQNRDLFEQAASNMGFENLAELVKVSGWLSNEIDSASIASNMDDPSSAPMVPKPEFKEQFEAWLEERRHRLVAQKACKAD
jgi:hypothetical protein